MRPWSTWRERRAFQAAVGGALGAWLLVDLAAGVRGVPAFVDELASSLLLGLLAIVAEQWRRGWRR